MKNKIEDLRNLLFAQMEKLSDCPVDELDNEVTRSVNMSLKVLLPTTIPPIENEKGLRNISVLRLSCEEKYYIAKTANPSWMIDELKNVYGKYQRGGILETNLFYPLVKYIHSHQAHVIKVEVLFTSTNGYEVLKYELEQLVEHFGHKDCLNKNNIPHIPKTVRAKKGANWLTVNEDLNFRKLLKKYQY